MTDLSEMRRVAESATPGPWEQVDVQGQRSENGVGVRGCGDFDWVATLQVSNVAEWRENAAHIATFDPPTVLALLDAAALLEKTICRVEGYTGPPVWWESEARSILSRLESL